jgi:hypothetical protein
MLKLDAPEDASRVMPYLLGESRATLAVEVANE